MDCDIAREALSARIDGEREPVPASRVDEHLADCEPCRAWQATAVGQTQLLRRLAGRSHVAVVREPSGEQKRRSRPLAMSWRRWALGAVGAIQLGLALAQGLGAELGLPRGHGGQHVLNESTAWSAALGVVMLIAAIRPIMAGGLTWVLGTFAAFLAVYEITDADHGLVGIDRLISHLPVVVGAVLALLVWHADRPGSDPEPDRTVTDDIVLPDNASRGRRRSHLRSSDGSAA